jgi:hypothetical protein
VRSTSVGQKAQPHKGSGAVRSLLGAADASRRIAIEQERLDNDPADADPVIRGFAANPATPEDLLLRLVDEHPETVASALRRRHHLPSAVVVAAMRHPSPRARNAVAGNHRVDPVVRLRLIDDPDRRVADTVRSDRGLALPIRAFRPALDRLAGFHRDRVINDDELRADIFDLVSMDPRALRAAATHPEPLIRAAVVEPLFRANRPSDDWLRHEVRVDPAPEVRAAVGRFDADRDRVYGVEDMPCNGYRIRWMLRQCRLTPELVAEQLAIEHEAGLEAIAGNPHLSPEAVEALMDHARVEVRRGLADRADLTPPQLARLSADPDVTVRTAVSVNPALTEEQRAAIDIDPDREPSVGIWSRSHHPTRFRPLPLEESVRYAGSVNPFLRRRAATDPRLPDDVVAALADDPDPHVRAILALFHPAAPPALLLRVFREHTWCERHRLPDLPNFPTRGLADLVDDPDPYVRRLAARDPDLDPAVADRLTGDPDERVRRAMAASPRLPTARIVALLDDPDLGESAASNPALPIDVMRARIDAAAG